MKTKYFFLLFVSGYVSLYAENDLNLNDCGLTYFHNTCGDRFLRTYVACENGTAKKEAEKKVEIYLLSPNPTDGLFKLTSSEPMQNAEITMTDQNGSILEQRKVTGTEVVFNLANREAGRYLIIIKSNNTAATESVIKK
ncbi:MAG: T9SS type A sorting domain-containing protein [Chitinophagales bacterium]